MKPLAIAVALLLSLLLCSCNVFSENAVMPGDGAQSVPPEAFLGHWVFQEWNGKPSNGKDVLDVSLAEDGTLTFTLSEGDEVAQDRGVLARINDTIILSMKREDEESWILIKVTLRSDGTIALHEIELFTLRAGVEKGLLAGEVNFVDRDDFIVNISATSAELASYFASEPAAFGEAGAVLAREP